jgi:hypothetical protein
VTSKKENTMATLSKTYPNEDAGRGAVDTLRAASVPPREIRRLTSRPLADIRREPVGGFAGPVGPDAPVGNFAGGTVRRSDAAGGFATGSFAGDAHQLRQGSFGDVECVTIVTYKLDAERSRVAGYRGIRLLLRRAALDDDAVEGAVEELHKGRTVVLVDVPEIASVEAEAQLEEMAKAA